VAVKKKTPHTSPQNQTERGKVLNRGKGFRKIRQEKGQIQGRGTRAPEKKRGKTRGESEISRRAVGGKKERVPFPQRKSLCPIRQKFPERGGPMLKKGLAQKKGKKGPRATGVKVGAGGGAPE